MQYSEIRVVREETPSLFQSAVNERIRLGFTEIIKMEAISEHVSVGGNYPARGAIQFIAILGKPASN